MEGSALSERCRRELADGRELMFFEELIVDRNRLLREEECECCVVELKGRWWLWLKEDARVLGLWLSKVAPRNNIIYLIFLDFSTSSTV